MISLLVETTLHSLTNAMISLNLPTFPRNVMEREFLASLLLFSVPRLAVLKDRFESLPPDLSIELSAHPMTLLEELQARILAKSGSGNASFSTDESPQTSGICLNAQNSFAPGVSDVKADD
jgi:hypothetical protein